ncbi:MAG: class I SAM-dependent methyltransferase [Deltaproteobacteria bacterium]|nr:class I SAM-dependent methyltransferase [Deltaproteobacteria bacterium]
MTTPEIFDDIWTRGHYREGSTCQRLLPFLRKYIPEGSTVNDYGSGTGRAEKGLLEFCSRVNMVDFADVALEDEARAMIGDRLTYTVCPLETLPADFPVTDWGICINVLMLVDPAKLDKIISEMQRTCSNLIVELYDAPDNRLGENRTLIMEGPVWWMAKLAEFWPHVNFIQSPEHKRRYIFICRYNKPFETFE